MISPKYKWYSEQRAVLFMSLGTLILLVTVAASLFDFLSLRSFWVDEAMLARNIVEKNYLELLKPLNYDQVSPLGFLYLEKSISSLFNYTDWSFRILPYFFFLGSIPLLFLYNLHLFTSRYIAIIACILFSINPIIFSYSIEVKQYICDVFITLLLLVSYSHHDLKSDVRSQRIYLAICIVSVWLSNVAIIILFTIVLYDCFRYVTTRKKRLILYTPTLLGMASFGLYYVLFIYNHPAKIYMLLFWENHGGFSPQSIFSGKFYSFHVSRFQSIIMMLFRNQVHWFLLFLLMCYGLIKFRTNLKVFFFSLTPLLIFFGLVYFRFYPYSARTILFIFPLLLSVLAAGTWSFIRFLERVSGLGIWRYALFVPILINLSLLLNSLPIKKEEMKLALHFLNENIANKDNIYVFSATEPSFGFYFKGYENLREKGVYYSEMVTDHLQKTKKDEFLEANNIWIIYTDNYPKILYKTNDLTETESLLIESGFYGSLTKNFQEVHIKKYEKIKY